MRKPIAIAFTTAILVCTLFVSAAFADEKGCTIANVKGAYGFVGSGTVLASNLFGLPPGTFSSMGTLTFDGKGNVLIVETGRTDDIFFTPDQELPSTYIVNDQCVVTFTITAYANAGLPGPHVKGVFVDNRKGLRGINLLPGWVVQYASTTRITAEDKD